MNHRRSILTMCVTLSAGAATPARAATPEAPAESVKAGVAALSDALAEKLLATHAGLARLAVLPFETLDGEARSKELGKLSAALLASRLGARKGILQVERARLDTVVGELKGTESGQMSPEGAASVGKLLGANQVVLGSIAASGPIYVLTTRLVDSESGLVLLAADREISREGLIAMNDDLVEIKSPAGAALRSTAVPGWGQLYNGDLGRGVTYLTLFAGFATTAGVSAVLGAQAETDYAKNTARTVGRRADANDHYQRANYALIGLGVTWAVSVVDAWLTGKDERTLNVPDTAPEAGPG